MRLLRSGERFGPIFSPVILHQFFADVTVEGRGIRQMTLRGRRPVWGLKVNEMIQQRLLVVLLLAVGVSPSTVAQINCGSGSAASGKLSCLIPATVTPSGYTFSDTSTANLNSSHTARLLQTDLGGEISQIPLASPASGIIFTIDPTLHVPVPSDQSLGPILTQRAETIGKHKLYAAFTYQYFLLQDVDGHGLKSLPAVFLLSSSSNPNPSSPDSAAIANSRIDLKVHQWVGYLTYGLTDRVDVSVAVPLLRVNMRDTINEQIFNLTTGTTQTRTGFSQAGEATGIGDVVLAVKATFWKMKHGGLALGSEFRLPTGDEQNFLGSGTFGVKPFAAFTYGGKISPHVNVGYLANGNTELVVTNAGNKGGLPNRLTYSGGADWRATSKLTIAGDVLAQRVFQAPQVQIVTNFKPFPVANPGFTIPQTTVSSTGTYNRTDGSIGFKFKPLGGLLLTGNLLVKLDQGGLRYRMAPLFGASYTFNPSH